MTGSAERGRHQPPPGTINPARQPCCFHPLGQEGCQPLPHGWFPGLSPAGPHAPSASCFPFLLLSLCFVLPVLPSPQIKGLKPQAPQRTC